RRLVHRADFAGAGGGPAAVGVLAAGRDEILHEAAVPFFPFLAADLVHGVGGVVLAVVEVDRAVEVGFQVLDAFRDFLRLVFAGEEEDAEAGSGAGEAGGAGVRHVGEAAGLRAVTGLDVAEGVLDRLFGDVHAGVLGGAEGHHLHDR